MSLKIKLKLDRDNFRLQFDTTLAAEGFTAIYGHSGSGKTTLLRWLAGLEKAPGELYFNEQTWQDADSFLPSQQRRIGYVFQEPRLFAHLSVMGNLEFAWKRRFDNNGPRVDDVVEWLELHALVTQGATTLSGGQQQRVAIARALLSSPQLLMMDEPVAALDQGSRQRILSLLERLQGKLKVPVLYVSHSIEEVSRLADQLVLLDNGHIAAQGPLLELCHKLHIGLSHEENAASIITATMENHDLEYGLSELIIGDNQRLYLTHTGIEPGRQLRVRIPARDVSLALQKPEQSSILNILRCTIDAIEKTPDSRVLVRLAIGDQFLLARLTHKSLDRLQLKAGQNVYAQIKTVALLNERQHSQQAPSAPLA